MPDPRSEVEIRRATAADAQRIGEVFDASVAIGWAYLGELVVEPLYEPKHWDQLIADHAPPNELLVATDQSGQIVGYSAIHPEDGELFLLFVHPDFGERGIGKMLLDAAHDVLREAGRTESFLFTEERNARARRVYARAGYRHDGSVRESDFRGAPIRELRLVKEL